MINMKKLIVVAMFIAIGPILSACVTAEDMAANNDTANDSECRSYGVKPGSHDYYQCRMIKNEQLRRQDAAFYRANNELIARGLAMASGTPVAPSLDVTIHNDDY
jgi:hypothetical protein